ncbi:RNA-binding protein [Mesorhizobium sp. IMUNJ 23232]|uniref:RNA-binding protein n=1 Tax=Mesorhizobium sp. IMUNJ 23232 TaxID=3376064 RepID=UPI00378F9021
MPFTRRFGAFNPAELEIIQKVFDRLCDERRLAQNDIDQREELAAEVIHVFQQGRTAEADLWRSLSERRMAQDSPLPDLQERG